MKPETIRIGLISDTHTPERCDELPAAVFEIFKGVDLILHAGDVGKLWVLDQLSALAPVVAVHGNDETAEAQRELPNQQVITIGGRRVLLWHSHFQDHHEEMLSRGGDWAPKLDRQVQRARQAGAAIVIYGHTHIPINHHLDGIHIINPGALHYGGPFTRQVVRSVGLLELPANGDRPQLRHFEIANPQRAFDPIVDFSAPYHAAHRQFEPPIVSPDLAELLPVMGLQEYQDLERLKQPTLRLARQCWMGERPYFTRHDLLAAIEADPDIHPQDRETVETILRN